MVVAAANTGGVRFINHIIELFSDCYPELVKLFRGIWDLGFDTIYVVLIVINSRSVSVEPRIVTASYANR